MSQDVHTPARRRTTPLRTASRQASRTARALRWVLVVFGVVIIVDALVGDRGLLASLRARDQHAALSTAIRTLEADNERLREELRRLKEDPAAVEEIARRELGLIRPGEKVFIVKDLPSPAATTF